MGERILIIGAKDSADIALAANAVRQFMKHTEETPRAFGRYHSILFTFGGRREAVAVWHTRFQITVHFGDR